MKTKIIVAGAGIVLAAALLYFARNTKQPPVQQAQGLIRPDARTVSVVCVEKVQNLSHQSVDMDGVDEELVAQLQKVGLQSHKVSDVTGKQCEATVNAELVELSGRGRKTARVDFRLTLAGEQPPRMSSSAEGKSTADGSKFTMAFVASKQRQEKTSAEREAIFAALQQQAIQIDTANKRGLPPWLPATK
jgi:hypothetical protein